MAARTLIGVATPREIATGEYEYIGRLADDPDLEEIRVGGRVLIHSRSGGEWYVPDAALIASSRTLRGNDTDG